MKKLFMIMAILLIPACGFDIKRNCDGPINIENVTPANVLITSNTGTFPVTFSVDLMRASGDVHIFATVTQPSHPELNVTMQTYIGHIGLCTDIAMSLQETIDTTGMGPGESGDIFFYAEERSGDTVLRSGTGSTIHYSVQ